MFGVSIGIGWPAPSLPKLLADDSPIPITRDEASWLVAFLLIGFVVAPLPAAYFMDKYAHETYSHIYILLVVYRIVFFLADLAGNQLCLCPAYRILLDGH